jgi:hypothetical protein
MVNASRRPVRYALAESQGGGDHSGFHRHLLANPSDSVARMAYADKVHEDVGEAHADLIRRHGEGWPAAHVSGEEGAVVHGPRDGLGWMPQHGTGVFATGPDSQGKRFVMLNMRAHHAPSHKLSWHVEVPAAEGLDMVKRLRAEGAHVQGEAVNDELRRADEAATPAEPREPRRMARSEPDAPAPKKKPRPANGKRALFTTWFNFYLSKGHPRGKAAHLASAKCREGSCVPAKMSRGGRPVRYARTVQESLAHPDHAEWHAAMRPPQGAGDYRVDWGHAGKYADWLRDQGLEAHADLIQGMMERSRGRHAAGKDSYLEGGWYFRGPGYRDVDPDAAAYHVHPEAGDGGKTQVQLKLPDVAHGNHFEFVAEVPHEHALALTRGLRAEGAVPHPRVPEQFRHDPPKAEGGQPPARMRRRARPPLRYAGLELNNPAAWARPAVDHSAFHEGLSQPGATSDPTRTLAYADKVHEDVGEHHAAVIRAQARASAADPTGAVPAFSPSSAYHLQGTPRDTPTRTSVDLLKGLDGGRTQVSLFMRHHANPDRGFRWKTVLPHADAVALARGLVDEGASPHVAARVALHEAGHAAEPRPVPFARRGRPVRYAFHENQGGHDHAAFHRSLFADPTPEGQLVYADKVHEDIGEHHARVIREHARDGNGFRRQLDAYNARPGQQVPPMPTRFRLRAHFDRGANTGFKIVMDMQAHHQPNDRMEWESSPMPFHEAEELGHGLLAEGAVHGDTFTHRQIPPPEQPRRMRRRGSPLRYDGGDDDLPDLEPFAHMVDDTPDSPPSSSRGPGALSTVRRRLEAAGEAVDHYMDPRTIGRGMARAAAPVANWVARRLRGKSPDSGRPAPAWVEAADRADRLARGGVAVSAALADHLRDFKAGKLRAAHLNHRDVADPAHRAAILEWAHKNGHQVVEGPSGHWLVHRDHAGDAPWPGAGKLGDELAKSHRDLLAMSGAENAAGRKDVLNQIRTMMSKGGTGAVTGTRAGGPKGVALAGTEGRAGKGRAARLARRGRRVRYAMENHAPLVRALARDVYDPVKHMAFADHVQETWPEATPIAAHVRHRMQTDQGNDNLWHEFATPGATDFDPAVGYRPLGTHGPFELAYSQEGDPGSNQRHVVHAAFHDGKGRSPMAYHFEFTHPEAEAFAADLAESAPGVNAGTRLVGILDGHDDGDRPERFRRRGTPARYAGRPGVGPYRKGSHPVARPIPKPPRRRSAAGSPPPPPARPVASAVPEPGGGPTPLPARHPLRLELDAIEATLPHDAVPGVHSAVVGPSPAEHPARTALKLALSGDHAGFARLHDALDALRESGAAPKVNALYRDKGTHKGHLRVNLRAAAAALAAGAGHDAALAALSESPSGPAPSAGARSPGVQRRQLDLGAFVDSPAPSGAKARREAPRVDPRLANTRLAYLLRDVMAKTDGNSPQHKEARAALSESGTAAERVGHFRRLGDLLKGTDYAGSVNWGRVGHALALEESLERVLDDKGIEHEDATNNDTLDRHGDALHAAAAGMQYGDKKLAGKRDGEWAPATRAAVENALRRIADRATKRALAEQGADYFRARGLADPAAAAAMKAYAGSSAGAGWRAHHETPEPVAPPRVNDEAARKRLLADMLRGATPEDAKKIKEKYLGNPGLLKDLVDKWRARQKAGGAFRYRRRGARPVRYARATIGEVIRHPDYGAIVGGAHHPEGHVYRDLVLHPDGAGVLAEFLGDHGMMGHMAVINAHRRENENGGGIQSSVQPGEPYYMAWREPERGMFGVPHARVSLNLPRPQGGSMVWSARMPLEQARKVTRELRTEGATHQSSDDEFRHDDAAPEADGGDQPRRMRRPGSPVRYGLFSWLGGGGKSNLAPARTNDTMSAEKFRLSLY